MANILYYLQNFTNEYIEISFWILLSITCCFVAYWFYNRKKLQKLSHQIPASVVKNYLDSIIQNSTALKSSLFRGGGLDIADSIPSVKTVRSLESSSSVQVASGSSEELTQKSAEIASLKSQLQDKDNLLKELERNLEDLQMSGDDNSSELVDGLKANIAELEEKLANGASSPEGGSEELATVTKERDELRERLMEYEIIEEDLANLKRLQKENEQLKKTLSQMQGDGAPATDSPAESAPAAIAEAESELDEDSDALEQQLAASEADEATEEAEAEVEEVAETQEEPAEVDNVESIVASADEQEPSPAGDQKSAEELLSEFEKMLG